LRIEGSSGCIRRLRAILAQTLRKYRAPKVYLKVQIVPPDAGVQAKSADRCTDRIRIAAPDASFRRKRKRLEHRAGGERIIWL
jgi:hypothetical protein